VKNWALKFGVDLWEFGRQFTKMSEIQKVSNTVLIKRRLTLVLIQRKIAQSCEAVVWNSHLLKTDSPFPHAVTA
jgi:hypothetical protein